MKQNRFEEMSIGLRQEKVILDRDAAELFGVGIDAISKVVRGNPDRFPSDFIITLTDEEKQQAKALSSSYAFTEAGILMLATLIDSDIAQNVALEIIETFTEQRQFLRHIMTAEYTDEDEKKKEETYMEDTLKYIFARSLTCV